MKESKSKHPTPSPLPVHQIASVIFTLISESNNFNVYFPFLVFFVDDVGYGGNRLGFYTGLLTAGFCGAQFLSSILWGTFSDKFGRKLSIILGLIGSALGTLLFGLSRTYEEALSSRILSGLLCGNIGITKSFLTEITDDSNRGRGFSMITVAWAIGTILSSFVGGMLCKPALKYPSHFSQDGLFGKFPYLLPCLLCVLFNILSLFVVWYIMYDVGESVKEYDTLPTESEHDSVHQELPISRNFTEISTVTPKSFEVDEDGDITEILFDINDEEDPNSEGRIEPPHGLAEANHSVLLRPIVLLTTSSYGFVSFGFMVFNDTVPLFLKEKSSMGGFDLSSSHIGLILSISGIATLIFSFTLLPIIASYSKIKIMRFALLISIPFIATWPLFGMNKDAIFKVLHLKNQHQEDAAIMTILILLNVCKVVLQSVAFTSSMILINNCVENKHLGKANGLGQTFASLARALGPAIGGATWSYGARNGFIYLNFILISMFLIVCLLVNLFLPNSLDYRLA